LLDSSYKFQWKYVASFSFCASFHQEKLLAPSQLLLGGFQRTFFFLFKVKLALVKIGVNCYISVVSNPVHSLWEICLLVC